MNKMHPEGTTAYNLGCFTGYQFLQALMSSVFCFKRAVFTMAFVMDFSVSRGFAHELFYVIHRLWVVGTARVVITILQAQKGFVIWPGSHRWWAPEPSLHLGPFASSSPCCLTVQWYLPAFRSRCPLSWICDMLLQGNFQSNRCDYQLIYHHHQSQKNSERAPKASGLINGEF